MSTYVFIDKYLGGGWSAVALIRVLWCLDIAVQPGLQRSFKDIGESPKIFEETSKSPKKLYAVHRMLTAQLVPNSQRIAPTRYESVLKVRFVQ